MPTATLDDLALRSTNPVKRAMDVLCVVLLQLLTRMVLAVEPDQDKYRNHPAFRPCSILSRLQAGDTFDLPAIAIASIRAMVSAIAGDLRLHSAGVAPSAPPTPAAPTKARRRRATTRHPTPSAHRRAPDARETASRSRTTSIAGLTKRIAHSALRLPTSISLRYSNEHSAA